MISLWADLLRRWLASRALQEETPHDHCKRREKDLRSC
jgi:hypothetical protein